ncbi:MAG TPA: FAD-linked oxidase C-terminal domain-containing protein, partial [Actinomycetota bacterium]|nr:FAD-linked oxidase C-terminal domain-containing protein [Actinomycetota bacterium]
EDTIVAVERLPGYIRELDALFSRYGTDVVWYGHASTGLIHTRPFLDLTSASDLTKLERLMADAVDLVNAWGGDLCGEHGDGLARAYWNERLFGPALYGQLRAIKAAFDPADLLNPGKVVEGPRPTEDLRYGPGYTRRVPATSFSYADQGGFAAAAERCFGAGACRKRLQGTMCPPAAATGLEEHSTRARANLLRSVVAGELDPGDLSTPEAHEVMGTCVGCKACKTECPAQVDLARLKSEWMDMTRRAEGATPLQAMTARLRELAAAGSRTPRLVNRVMSTTAFKRRLGIALQRELPPLAREPLTRRMARDGDALLFADCFTTYQEPEVGEAARDLVARAGRTLGLVDAGCCGRTMLSEGYIGRARRAAERAARVLRSTDGPILFCEPSCLSAVTDDWPHLIEDVSDIVARSRPAEAYVSELGLDYEQGGAVLLHGHCHQKALWGTADTRVALAAAGAEITEPDAGCCGMAGGFGYREERYHLSVAMGERVLAPAVREAEGAEVVATGTSCRHQIADLTGREAVHPLVYLARRLRT